MQKPILGALCLIAPSMAWGHGFGAAYNLPVPLALYNWGAGATLALSFLLVGLLWTKPPSPTWAGGLDLSSTRLFGLLKAWAPTMRALALMLLLLCIATGFLGSRDPTRNFAPIFFWIIFLLLFTYTLAFSGDVYAALNPFRSFAECLTRPWQRLRNGLFQYPEKLGSWPAVALYLCFIWFELFSHRTPKTIAAFLLAYALFNTLGMVLIGSKAWFRHCEFFSVFFRLISLIGPIDCRHDQDGKMKLALRPPLSGLYREQAADLSIVVFVLAMISTTAFDGLQATKWWVMLFWSDPSGIITQFAGGDPMRHMRSVMPFFMAWQSVWLFLSPFVYLAAFIASLSVMKWLTRSSLSVLDLAKQFSFSLIPIALVYNITHYWTLITQHALKILSLISDPFGWRWDLFGTAMKFRAPILPDMGVVWHSQVGLILVGHILSVWVAHVVALRLWPSRRQALLSQLPLLLLMMSFTIFGLWVLAQPLTTIRPT